MGKLKQHVRLRVEFTPVSDGTRCGTGVDQKKRIAGDFIDVDVGGGGGILRWVLQKVF